MVPLPPLAHPKRAERAYRIPLFIMTVAQFFYYKISAQLKL